MFEFKNNFYDQKKRERLIHFYMCSDNLRVAFSMIVNGFNHIGLQITMYSHRFYFIYLFIFLFNYASSHMIFITSVLS